MALNEPILRSVSEEAERRAKSAPEADTQNGSFLPYAYHEMPERPAQSLDVLEQLKTNIRQLEDLHGRLQFMMAEVKGLVRKM